MNLWKALRTVQRVWSHIPDQTRNDLVVAIAGAGSDDAVLKTVMVDGLRRLAVEKYERDQFVARQRARFKKS